MDRTFQKGLGEDRQQPYPYLYKDKAQHTTTKAAVTENGT